MWPFSKKRKAPQRTSTLIEISRDGDYLSVDSMNFFGVCAFSPNKKYIVATMESDWSSREQGAIVLLEEKRIIFTTQAERPNDGKVADNGNFIVNDWLFGDSLSGAFCAFNRGGELILRQSFKANLLNNGISRDGRFAVSQTCNSRNDDSSVLTIYDLESRSLNAQIIPETGWADAYSFDNLRNSLFLLYNDGTKYEYNLHGKFLDAAKWDNKRRHSANPFELHAIAAEELRRAGKDMDDETSKRVLVLLHKALEQDLIQQYPREAAMINRHIGEIHLVQGLVDSAISYFELALSLDEKVRVRRRLKKLRELRTGP